MRFFKFQNQFNIESSGMRKSACGQSTSSLGENLSSAIKFLYDLRQETATSLGLYCPAWKMELIKAIIRGTSALARLWAYKEILPFRPHNSLARYIISTLLLSPASQLEYLQQE